MTTNDGVTMMVPIGELARDPNPNRQVRTGGINGIDIREIERLYTQESPNEWGDMIVRLWPKNELDQRPNATVKYQVMIGNHRYVTARDPLINLDEYGIEIGLNLSEVSVIIRDWDDATYYRESYQSNRGPAPLTAEDKAIAVKRMQALYPDTSQGDLAKMLNVKKSYVHNMLSGRDTNAGRSLRQATGERSSDTPRMEKGDKVPLPREWRVAPASADRQRLITIGTNLSDWFASVPDPADVRAYVNTLNAQQRAGLVSDSQSVAAWLEAFADVVGAGNGVLE